ncbi:hypothetical protein BLGA_03840 [Bifidobacterium longum subsp. longum]|nr:hypothetical protein BLGA_03840 [Bifidobacterium longum subsp. longum]
MTFTMVFSTPDIAKSVLCSHPLDIYENMEIRLKKVPYASIYPILGILINRDATIPIA